MTPAHIIFIPSILMLGLIIGFFLGGRAARDAMNAQEVRKERRAAAKKARDEAAAKNE
jgi:hypothetical protein